MKLRCEPPAKRLRCSCDRGTVECTLHLHVALAFAMSRHCNRPARAVQRKARPEQNSLCMRRASVTQRWLDTRSAYVLTCSCNLLASQLFVTRLRWPCDRNPAHGNLQKHFAVQAAATVSGLRLPCRATQRRCNFARAATAHGVYVARASSKSSVMLQLAGWLYNRLQ